MIKLFYGEEDFLIEEEISRHPVKEKETFSGAEPALELIIQALQSQGLFVSEKLLVIENTDFGLKVWEGLIPSLGDLSPKTEVVFTAESIDRRTKLYRLIEEKGEIKEFPSFAPWQQEELIAWILGRAKLGGKKIAPHAARILQETCGNNLRKLVSEIEKLITYLGERQTIEEVDVKALASPGELAAFSLVDALREKNLGRALEVLSKLNRSREEPIGLLSLLAGQVRMMLQVKSLEQKKMDAYQMAKLLGARPYFVKQCLSSAHRFTLDELIGGVHLLHEADLKMKSGANQQAVLELLLSDLCHGS